MSVEGGSISAAISSVAVSPSIAPSIGGGVIGVAPAIEAGGFSAPNIGIGPEITGFSLPINEGPVVGFNPQEFVTLAINPSDAVFEAESILAQAAKFDISSAVSDVFRTALADVNLDPTTKPIFEPPRLHSLIEPNLETPVVKPTIVRQAVYWYADNPQDVKAAEVIIPKAEPAPTPLAVSSQWEYAVPLTHSLPTLKPNVKLENPLGFQEVVEELVVEDQQEVLEEDQEVEEFITKYLVDEEVSEERRTEIRQAIKLAIAEIQAEGIKEKEIEGWRIIKYLKDHAGVRSEIVKNEGPDGSFEETLQAISSQRFTSEKEAVKRADEIIAQKEPVKRGKFGREVTFEAVARVLKRIFKSAPKEALGAKITNIRKYRISKVNPNRVLTEITQKINTETKIEDNPHLAGIFGVGLTPIRSGLTKYNLQG